MPILPTTTPRILLTLLATAPPAASLLLYIYLRQSPGGRATWTTTATPLHASSYPISVANPRRLATQSDSLTLRLKLPRDQRRLDDEQLLARFTRGFFGGWSFTPERLFFALTGREITRFSDISVSPSSDHTLLGSQAPAKIWSLSSLSRDSVPPLGSILFNNFYLLDSSSAAPSARTALFPASVDFPRPSCAFAEFAFGSDKSSFAGSHRFEVRREPADAGVKDEDVVVVTVSHVRCNPTRDSQFLPAWTIYFHEIYAKFLFADGIREVLRV